jgi:hypothetical protein
MATGRKIASWDPAGLPFAHAGNIQNGFHLEDADLLQPGSVHLAGDFLSRPGDIVFPSKGTVGRFAFVKPTTSPFVYAPQLCYWRIKRPSLIDPRYLFYWMQGEEFLTQVHQVKSQTTIADYVSLGDQRRMYILAPPLPLQRTIAGILAAYDDLIEKNTRRIANLEERCALNTSICWRARRRFAITRSSRCQARLSGSECSRSASILSCLLSQSRRCSSNFRRSFRPFFVQSTCSRSATPSFARRASVSCRA